MKLGILHQVRVRTDLNTMPWVQEAGVEELDQQFFASGNVATVGGCLVSQYLAAWLLARLVGLEETQAALHYVASVGEKVVYVQRAMENVGAYLPRGS